MLGRVSAARILRVGDDVRRGVQRLDANEDGCGESRDLMARQAEGLARAKDGDNGRPVNTSHHSSLTAVSRPPAQFLALDRRCSTATRVKSRSSELLFVARDAHRTVIRGGSLSKRRRVRHPHDVLSS
jgi:hypothetical protein